MFPSTMKQIPPNIFAFGRGCFLIQDSRILSARCSS